jgi:PAS domain S-box-containing protein
MEGVTLAAISELAGWLGHAVIGVQRGGRIIGANERAEQLTGRASEELVKLSDLAELLPPAERHQRLTHRLLRRSGALPNSPTPSLLQHKDGTIVPVAYLVVPIALKNESAVIILDRSAERRREELIDWYETLCQRMPMGVMIAQPISTSAGPRLKLLFANTAASSALGLNVDQMIGRTLAELFPDSINDGDRDRVFASLGTTRTQRLSNIVIGDPADPTQVFRRTIVPLSNDAVAMLIDDVTHMVRDDHRSRALMERIVALADSDRRTIAMGIHDDPLQQIAAGALLVAQARRRGPDARADWLQDADTALHRAMDSLRHLVFELSPPELAESGLATALRTAADYVFAETETVVDVNCAEAIDGRSMVSQTAFRIATEALVNARKHSQASSVAIRIDIDADHLRLQVADDGEGIASAVPLGHYGLSNMRDRAEAIGGTCDISSSPLGTVVDVILPVHSQPVSGHENLVEKLRELDLERSEFRVERDQLHEQAERTLAEKNVAVDRLDRIINLPSILREAAPEAVAHLTCRALTNSVADSAGIRLWDRPAELLRIAATWHNRDDQRTYLNNTFFIDRGPDSQAYLVATTGAPVLIDRLRTGWRPSEAVLPPEGPVRIHSALMVPIWRSGVVIGVITVGRDENPVTLSLSDLAAVEAIAAIYSAHAVVP